MARSPAFQARRQKAAERIRNVHWRAPTVMLLSLAMGCALAVGHHLYYRSLDGKVVEDHNQQTWSIRIGTGLAFLIKVLLTTAISIACSQALWWLLNSKTFSISNLDSLTSVLSNPLSFFDFKIWIPGYLVFTLAIVAWSIPLATVVTPATLTIRLSPDFGQTHQAMRIPSIDWNASVANMVVLGAYCANSISVNDTTYCGPSLDIQRIAALVSMTGSILPISPPTPNCLYSFRFPGPALKCIDATQTMAKTAAAVIFGHFSAHSPAPFYYANSQSPFEDLLSFMVSPTNSSDSNQGVNDITGVGFGPGTGVLWVTTAGPDFYGGAERNQVVVRQCNLYLASYDIVIRYDNGFQSLNVVNVDYQTPFDVNNVKNLSLIPEQANSNMTYLAVMDAFTVAFGGICNSASLMQYPICEGSNTLFTSLLANANEFSSFINSSLTPNLRGLIAGRNFTLSRGLEEVFQNITLSLLGFPSFLKTLNETPKTNVTVFSPQNIFNYDPQNLWLAYGLAAGFSIIATIVGFVLLFINGESFSNCCSAIVRITRSSQIAEAMNAEDISGADPLSKHFAKTKLFMDHGTPDSSESYKSLAPAAKLDKEASESLLEKNGTH